jgi:rhodanese-related sulfurtransferase
MVIIAVVLPILILILIRSLGVNHFKSDAKKLAVSSVKKSNIITGEQINALSGEKLIINMGEAGSGLNEITSDALFIAADSILSKNNLSIIRKHDGPVLLVSSETAVSARIWMVLSQMGYKNIYILTNDADSEVLKYKFRPDTLVRPEL